MALTLHRVMRLRLKAQKHGASPCTALDILARIQKHTAHIGDRSFNGTSTMPARDARPHPASPVATASMSLSTASPSDGQIMMSVSVRSLMTPAAGPANQLKHADCMSRLSIKAHEQVPLLAVLNAILGFAQFPATRFSC